MILIKRNFNNLINYIINSSKNLIILRKINLSITQFDNYNNNDSSFKELNLVITLLFRDVNKGLINFEDLKI